MHTILLKHKRGLDYPPAPKTSAEIKSGVIITFREGGEPNEVIRGFNATSRMTRIPAGDVTLDHLEEDSPLAPLIIWDIAHAVPVGTTLHVLSDAQMPAYLDRNYFAGSFLKEGASYRKIAPLRAEADKGLDNWTFGIPVGPDDATVLNMIVAKVLSLDVPNKEIILCGRPGENFRFFDHVRIVGEDIPAPPVRISQKKNAIVEAAKHPNLCIFHDRVVLPDNFYEAMLKFGDLYPLSTFQSIYFDDYNCLIPRRYSDIGFMRRSPDVLPDAPKARKEGVEFTSLSQDFIGIAEGFDYVAGSAARYQDGRTYPTGSLYICKKSVWNFTSQDKDYYWAEMEDIEHAFRSAKMGVPNKVNPFTLTQSVFARPLLNFNGGSTVQKENGVVSLIRLPFAWLPGKRKPLLKLSPDLANKSFRRFEAKYKLNEVALFHAKTSMREYLEAYIFAIHAAKAKLTQSAASSFYEDAIKWLGFEQVVMGWKRSFVRRTYEQGYDARNVLTEFDGYLMSLASTRPKQGLFYSCLRDFLVRRTMFTKLAGSVMGWILAGQNGKTFYLEGGVDAYREAILGTIPEERLK